MKKKKKLASFLVVLLILALIAGVAYYFFAFDKKETKEETKTEEKKEEVKEAETITITFDVDGGKEVKELTVKVDEEVELPSTTKDGYTFKGWYLDDKKVDTKTSFKEDTTLKAKWEKKEEKKEEPKKEEKKVTYSCPDGYKLDGTKCTQTVAAKEKCEGERTFEYNGKCVTITAAARKDTKKACPKQHVTYMSFAGEVEGIVVDWGQWGCAYYKTNDTTQANCESHGFKWVTPEKACYVKWVGNGTTNTCDHLTNYAYITNPNSYQGVNGMNGGCFPVKEKTKYCEDGYTLNVANCVKTIEATKN